jgi:hypothetical protein
MNVLQDRGGNYKPSNAFSALAGRGVRRTAIRFFVTSRQDHDLHHVAVRQAMGPARLALGLLSLASV